MKEENETKTFTITTSPTLMRRIEKFFALLHFNSSFGHSGIFGMPLDGDGSEKVKIRPINRELLHQVDLIGGVGYDVELVGDIGYTGLFKDKNKRTDWYTRPAGVLYKDGRLHRSTPAYDDYDHSENTKVDVRDGRLQKGE